MIERSQKGLLAKRLGQEPRIEEEEVPENMDMPPVQACSVFGMGKFRRALSKQKREAVGPPFLSMLLALSLTCRRRPVRCSSP